MVEQSFNYVAWWGAGLSTLLALLKLWEMWRNRFRLDVGYNFTGDINVGNEIYIRNLSSKPVILSHWELFYRPYVWPFRKDKMIEDSGPFGSDNTIEPNSSITLSFCEEQHFNWSAKVMRNQRICIRLYAAGHCQVVKKVYG